MTSKWDRELQEQLDKQLSVQGKIKVITDLMMAITTSKHKEKRLIKELERLLLEKDMKELKESE